MNKRDVSISLRVPHTRKTINAGKLCLAGGHARSKFARDSHRIPDPAATMAIDSHCNSTSSLQKYVARPVSCVQGTGIQKPQAATHSQDDDNLDSLPRQEASKVVAQNQHRASGLHMQRVKTKGADTSGTLPIQSNTIEDPLNANQNR